MGTAAELLDELMGMVNNLPANEQKKIDELVKAQIGDMKWVPNPGPQTEAYFSLADELLYGGAAGGGKSQLLLGLALQEHQRSLILRRQNNEVDDLAERAVDIVGHREGYNGQAKRWRMPNGKLIQLGGCQHVGDERKYKGQAKDFLGFDEATEFLEHQVTYLMGWVRTNDTGQRTRVVFATNPPTTPEGEWVVRWFAPWIDKDHPLYPWPEGKLLWYAREEDGSFRFEDQPFEIETGGKKVRALSRTFIRSFLENNPEYDKTGEYAARLASQPEELRRRYERGEFMGDPEDDEWQVIPTTWVEEAQKRWTPEPPRGVNMSSLGADIAQGGKDRTVLAPRYDTWFAEPVVAPGKETPDGPSAAALIVRHLKDGAQVNIDMGGGWGGSCYDHLKGNDLTDVLGVNPAMASVAKTLDGKLKFANMRSELHWRFREALSPDSEHKLALPPGANIKAELCAARWKLTSQGILIEAKEQIIARLGRSPDIGDALMLAWYAGSSRKRRDSQGRAAGRMRGWQQQSVNPARSRYARYSRHSRTDSAYVRRNSGEGEQG